MVSRLSPRRSKAAGNNLALTHVNIYSIDYYHIRARAGILKNSYQSEDSFEITENGQTLSLTKERMQATFAEHFKEAERLVNETGYHRRDVEVEVLKGEN